MDFLLNVYLFLGFLLAILPYSARPHSSNLLREVFYCTAMIFFSSEYWIMHSAFHEAAAWQQHHLHYFKQKDFKMRILNAFRMNDFDFYS